MYTVGFSTGAVALGDFRLAVRILNGMEGGAIELSALRFGELQPLVNAVGDLDLAKYRHVAFHAPSRFHPEDEPLVVKQLLEVVERDWLIVAHPDVLIDWNLWRPLERHLCFENMDRRKPIGRTADELDPIFRFFPRATLCFDVGHAHQVDRTMTEARLILQRFGGRVRQLHVSEVNTASEHVRISVAFKLAVRKIADFLSDDVPLIIESVVPISDLERERQNVIRCFEQQTCTVGITD